MRVAVTGASGFLGKHLLRELLSRDLEVVAVTRTRPPDATARAKWVHLDLSDPGPDPFQRIGRPDVLIHLAWEGLPNYHASFHLSRELPRHLHFLERCLDSGLSRLTAIGTCLEYGLASGELHEAVDAQPTTDYGKAKAALCAWLVGQRKNYRFDLNWIRLFYLYGEGQAPTALYSLVRRAVAEPPHRLAMSKGDQIRDFLPVEVAASCIAKLAVHHADSGVVNVCSGRGVEVISMVQQWLGSSMSEVTIERGAYPMPDYEAFAAWGSRAKLDSILGAR